MPTYAPSVEFSTPRPWETINAPQAAGEYAPAPAYATCPPAETARSTPRTPAVAPAHTIAWLTRRTRGQMFATFDQFVRRAFQLGFMSNDARRLNADESARLRAAARALWERSLPAGEGMPGRVI